MGEIVEDKSKGRQTLMQKLKEFDFENFLAKNISAIVIISTTTMASVGAVLNVINPKSTNKEIVKDANRNPKTDIVRESKQPIEKDSSILELNPNLFMLEEVKGNSSKHVEQARSIN